MGSFLFGKIFIKFFILVINYYLIPRLPKRKIYLLLNLF